ncbi:MAG: CoA pyrophosphatase [Candidatus Eiseniibacteriota bacterium]
MAAGRPAPGVRYGPTAAALLRERGDHELTAGAKPPEKPLTPAAVLVPLIDRARLTVLLTQRTAHLDAHAGQISFPGGRVEAEDPDHVAAALRETREEVGIPAERVEVVGRLDDYITGTGFRVSPVVGVIRPPFDVQADPFEVADVFEVPLDFVLDPANHEQHTRIVNGIERRYYVLPYEGRYIWGATAGMLINLYEVLRG